MIPPPALAALLDAGDYTPTEIGIFLTAVAGLVMVGMYLVPKLREIPGEHRARKFPDHKVMDPIQVEELMSGTPPIIVDLRSLEEFKGELGRIRAAMNIPYPDLQRRIEELRGSTGNRPIVLPHGRALPSGRDLP
jgi:hypothetical protein